MPVQPIRFQRTPLLKTVVFVYLPVLLLICATVVVASVEQIPLTHFMRDVTVVAKVPPYVGALSNIGVLLWCATASMCLLTASVLQPASLAEKGFLLNAGLFTSLLMLDDLFLIHEKFVPYYLGLPDEAILVVYGALAAALFGYYRQTVYRSDYLLLLLGGAFFAGSVAFDLLQGHGLLSWVGIQSGELENFWEDSFKLFGIAGWFSYFGRVCYTSLTLPSPAEPTDVAPVPPV